jgi:ABC-type nitrate/sulfonate/bicarbonate transport system permease component
MAQCPHCHSTNVVVTEEVFTRKGRAFYRFWQTIVVIIFIAFGFTIGELFLGFFLGLGGGILVGIFSLVNAGKKSTSRTKLSCINCKEKTYLS